MAPFPEPDWPAWLHGFRPDQLRVTKEITARFDDGVKVVFLDAPTGAGKTLVGEMVRRELGLRGLYICSGKSLQEQFLRDFPYAKVLKGRANYPTQRMPAPYTGDDCLGTDCQLCDSRLVCPYQVAKARALGARVAVLNTSYLLTEANSGGAFGERKGVRKPFVVVDECDTLEAALMGYVEFRIGTRTLADLGIEAPIKGARKTTVERWLGEELGEALVGRIDGIGQKVARGTASLDEQRKAKRYTRLLAQAHEIRLSGEGDDEVWGDWIRQYERDSGAFVLKPVLVDAVGEQVLWRHADRWLCMSATIISADEQARSLGLERAGTRWDVVSIPMRFARANRKVVIKPVANMTYQTETEELPKLVEGVKGVLAKYPTENVLIHTVSYRLTRGLEDALKGCEEAGKRKVLTYHSGTDRDGVVGRFRDRGGILLAPSLERGIDLPDDLCRVVICAKMPFPSLGDRRVSERLRRPGGRLWYGVAVARSLVQMTGRGVRHEDDWAVAYILDRQFGRWWKDLGRRVLPGWWREAITGE